ncbi:uncharacterized protein BO66DRAFT_70572 [Aspergillus aculeatinus CBS 121060]|uniref:Uncharacterized protein n=1 Tax=Aspergillus aculeatinus CBS 121060 TaxID=1448322 RepID=A0ACD1HNK5_9EURO|nr:hypothetical protein BO66DRAFT_70572 [Aspergillus aculeatinus CBS 121060]RAH74967.1 hypothetical protein BO66DRAFT_70572 [Aspergillus aculeatinus CBS 121060]
MRLTHSHGDSHSTRTRPVHAQSLSLPEDKEPCPVYPAHPHHHHHHHDAKSMKKKMSGMNSQTPQMKMHINRNPSSNPIVPSTFLFHLSSPFSVSHESASLPHLTQPPE